MRQKLSAGLTFRVHDVETVRTSLEQCKTRDSIVKILTNVEQKKGEPVFACSGYNSDVVANTQFHALIGAVHIAFAEHRPLVLSPDAIWITILQGLAMHVHLHSEELQPVLVAHTGRKELTINLDIDPDSPESAWDAVINEFANSLNSEVEGSSLLLSDFSTTGVVEKLVSQVCLLDVFESFFEYILTCGCGFPEITLTGSQDDWTRLRQKIELLEPFKVDFWLPHLREIADHFCRAFSGNVDLNHWQDMYKQTQCYGYDLVNGWIVKLIPYLQNQATGNWDYINPLLHDADHEPYKRKGASTDQLPAGMSVVPFRCIDKSGNVRSMQMIGGFVGIEQNAETFAVQPKIGWAIRKAKESDWQFLDSARVQKTESLSMANLSAVFKMLLESTRYCMDISGEFVEFYKHCDGLVAQDKHGVTWTMRSLADVRSSLRDVDTDGSPDGIHYDPEVSRSDGTLFCVNQWYVEICDASDGSVVLMNTSKRRAPGIYDVCLIDAADKCTATFLGLRNFVAYLTENAKVE